jgi:two-component system, OmpR family, response regulator MtrA
VEDARPRILLVEDDATIRQMTKLSLERDGFAVETAHDSTSGLAAFRDKTPDLVVLDVMLPGVDGVSVCRSIRERSVVPIVMLTARTDPVDVVLGLEAGADDYVTKPFEPAILAARLRAVLRRVARHDASPVLRPGTSRSTATGWRCGSQERPWPSRRPSTACSSSWPRTAARC